MSDFVSVIVVVLLMLGAFGSMSRRYERAERPLLLLALCGHIASGAALTPLMRDYLGGGDMMGYHEVGCLLVERLWRMPPDTLRVLWGLVLQTGNPLPVPDLGLAISSTGSMLAFSTVVFFFTGGSLYGACVLMAGLSFFAEARIYDVFRAELPLIDRRRVLAATLLVPSIVFWSSGIIKEAFAIIGLGLVFKEMHRFYRQGFSSIGVLTAGVGLFLNSFIKGYLVLPLGAAAVATVVLGRDRIGRSSRARRLAAAAVGGGILLAAGILSSRYDPENIQQQAAQLEQVGQTTSAGSDYSIVADRSLAGQIAAAPIAALTAFFRPVIFESRNAQMVANSLETLVLTLLVLRILMRGDIVASYRLIRQEPILMFCSVFSIITAVGVGLASTNLGTLSRYRMPMIPFLWVLVTVVFSNRRAAAGQRQTGLNPSPHHQSLRIQTNGFRPHGETPS